MNLGIAIWLVAIICVCLLGLPEKWNNQTKDGTKIFKARGYGPYSAEWLFDSFVQVNAKYGIKITLIKIERKEHTLSADEYYFYYTEEKLYHAEEN